MNRETGVAEAYRAAVAWWREAGVDCDFRDEAMPWLGMVEAAATPGKPTAPVTPSQASVRAPAVHHSLPPIGGDRASWPATLGEFREWWLREPTLDDAGNAGRIVPRGTGGAAVMIFVGQPDEGDSQVLLSGRQGRVLDAFAQAAGIEETALYVASALPRVTPLPEWDALARHGLGDVARLHVQLAAPQRVLVFGRPLAALFEAAPDAAHPFVAGGALPPVLFAPSLDSLDRSPSRKKRFWRNWLDWTA